VLGHLHQILVGGQPAEVEVQRLRHARGEEHRVARVPRRRRQRLRRLAAYLNYALPGSGTERRGQFEGMSALPSIHRSWVASMYRSSSEK
jgi:hypothetical protein